MLRGPILHENSAPSLYVSLLMTMTLRQVFCVVLSLALICQYGAARTQKELNDEHYPDVRPVPPKHRPVPHEHAGPRLIALAKHGSVESMKKHLAKAKTPEEKQEMLNIVDKNGRNALISALERFQPDAARLLIDEGIDINATDTKGHTSLHWALWRKEIDIAELLIEKGVDVNHAGPNDKPALLWVAVHVELKDHDYLMHQLIDAGAELDVQDSNGYTALALSAMNGHEDCVKALLKRGANPNKLSYKMSHSALFLAALNGYTEIARDLVEAGAELGLKDSNGHTPLDIAKRNTRREIVTIIEDAMAKNSRKEEL